MPRVNTAACIVRSVDMFIDLFAVVAELGFWPATAGRDREGTLTACRSALARSLAHGEAPAVAGGK